MPALAASSPSVRLSFINLATGWRSCGPRALTLQPGALGPLVFRLVALLYSQLILPTPTGAGRGEARILGGAAGDWSGEGALSWPGAFDTMESACCGVALAVRIDGSPGPAPASAAMEQSAASEYRPSSASATPCGTSAGRPMAPARPRRGRRRPSLGRAPRRHRLVRPGVGVHALELAGLEAVDEATNAVAARGRPWSLARRRKQRPIHGRCPLVALALADRYHSATFSSSPTSAEKPASPPPRTRSAQQKAARDSAEMPSHPSSVSRGPVSFR